MSNYVFSENLPASYEKLKAKIDSGDLSQIEYSPSKKYAIMSVAGDEATYINFETHQTYQIYNNMQGAFGVKWFSEDIAEMSIACGTGLQCALIFLPPSTVVSCKMHDAKNVTPTKYEPAPSSNLPLTIDPINRLYVCYDRADNIQIFRLPPPTLATIKPPEHLEATKATIKNNQISIEYEDKNEKVKEITYSLQQS